ncbi:MAG: DUF2961 domain-containing protein [Gammaproteobacteria bacterium]|nr:DUF2961 domain-containing protein [Gammaproteobacteria bacterium]
MLAIPAVGADLDELYVLRKGQSQRSSSADPDWKNGNGDCRPIEPGQTLVIADMDGPGLIKHIWFTIAAQDPRYGRSLTLRMYWENEEEPAVESPIGDFFAVGHGALKHVNSMPVAVSSEGRAYNCYWPMPFNRHAKITLTNDSKEYKVDCVFWYVDYYSVPALPPGTGLFHAQYRQEHPCKAGEDYLILDAEGEGQYVGTVLSAHLRTASWFGEGDDRFYIDGATEPQLRGTGTEDYFCDAWGFRAFDRPYYGVTLLDGFDVGDRLTAYRWHIPDPVLFSKSLKVTIEHKGVGFDAEGKLVSGFEERQDLFSSVAFWYQRGRAKRFATLPPAAERVVPSRSIELEAFKDRMQATPEAVLQVQGGSYSAGNQVLAQFNSPEAKLRVPFEVKKPVKGLGRLKLTRSWDYGNWKVSLDGKPLPGMNNVDLFNAAVASQDYRIGVLDLQPGDHELTFECTGKHPQSKGYFLGIDALGVEEITPFVSERKK